MATYDDVIEGLSPWGGLSTRSLMLKKNLRDAESAFAHGLVPGTVGTSAPDISEPATFDAGAGISSTEDAFNRAVQSQRDAQPVAAAPVKPIAPVAPHVSIQKTRRAVSPLIPRNPLALDMDPSGSSPAASAGQQQTASTSADEYQSIAPSPSGGAGQLMSSVPVSSVPTGQTRTSQLSPAEYQQISQVLDNPTSNLSPEVRAAMEKARAEHELVSHVAQQLDPGAPLLPQALAMQPATTHPGGDDAARAEWITDPMKATVTGTKYFYEPPLQVAKKDLADPSYASLLNTHPDEGPITPEEIAGLTTDSPLYQHYADYQWKKAADDAAQAGKTVYRYSKAPWLQSGNGMGTLKTLGMKLAGSAVPLMNVKDALVLGVDKNFFGAGRRLQEHIDPSVREENAQTEAENQGTVALGAIGGAFALPGWAPAKAAFELASGARVLPAVAEGAGLVTNAARGAVNGLVAGGLGGAAVAGGEAGVNAAANAVENRPQEAPGDVASRVGSGALWGGLLGGALGSLGGIAQGARNFVGGRHGGQINEFERAGGRMALGGPVPTPAVEQAVKRGMEQGHAPVDVAAYDLAPQIERSTSGNVDATIRDVEAENRRYYSTPEGKARLPMTNVIAKATEMLRSNTAPVDGEAGLRDIVGKAHNDQVRAVLNNEISGVSTRPEPGAVEITKQEADAYLSSYHQTQLAEQLPKDAVPDTPVYLTPRRYNGEEMQSAAKRFYDKADKMSDNEAKRAFAELHSAALQDRDARTLGGIPGGWGAHKGSQSARLEAAKVEQRLAMPPSQEKPNGGAFNPLTEYATMTRGQLPMSNALRASADRGGARAELEQLRQLGVLQNIRAMASGGSIGGGHRSFYNPGVWVDAGLVRGYPILKSLAGPVRPVTLAAGNQFLNAAERAVGDQK